MRHRYEPGLLLVCLLAGTACGGGGGGSASPAPSPTPLVASFIPVTNTPPGNSIAMAEGAKNGDVLTIQVNVAGVSSVYGAALDLSYNSTQAAYVGYTPGTLLETGGNAASVQYDVNDAVAGRLTVFATRTGNLSGVNVTTSKTLINVTFRVLQAGTSQVNYVNVTLYDAGLPPQLIGGVTPFAGSLRGL